MTIPSLRMELQQFAEDVAEEIAEEVEEVDDFNFDDEPETTDEPESTEPPEEPEKSKFEFKIKYNKDEIVIDDEEKLRELAQKGMNYDKVLSRAEQLEQDELLKWARSHMSEVGYNDPKEFIQAIEQQKQQEAFEARVQQYLNQGYGEDVAQRFAEIEKENQSIKSELQSFTQKSQQQKELEDFIQWHEAKEEKGVYDKLDPQKIPQEVWDEVAKGTPLKMAYMDYMLPNVMHRIEQQAIQKITKNAQTSTGAIQSDAVDEGNWTHDYIERMAQSKGQAWVNANYDRIEKSGYFN